MITIWKFVNVDIFTLLFNIPVNDQYDIAIINACFAIFGTFFTIAYLFEGDVSGQKSIITEIVDKMGFVRGRGIAKLVITLFFTLTPFLFISYYLLLAFLAWVIKDLTTKHDISR